MSILKYLSPRLVLKTADGKWRRLNGGLGLPIEVIPRRKLVFERHRLIGPRSKALQALRMQLTGPQSPTKMVRITPDPDGDWASVWSWNASTNAGEIWQRQILPETLAQESKNDGVELARCVEGIEGRFWRQGVLKASQWWPEPPTENEWILFIRSARAPLNSESLSALKTENLTEIEWRENKRSFLFDRDNVVRTLNARVAALSVLVIFMFVIGFNGTKYLGSELLRRATEVQADKIASNIAPIFADRRRALAMARTAERSAQMAPNVTAFNLMTAVLAGLGDEETTITRIRLGDERIEVQGTGINTGQSTELVRRLEQIPNLNNVYISSSGDYFTINASIPPLIWRPSESRGAP